MVEPSDPSQRSFAEGFDFAEFAETGPSADTEAFGSATRVPLTPAGGADFEPFDPDFEDLAGPYVDEPAALPAVVAVVATAGASTLETCLRGLADTQYPQLTVVVVDGSADGSLGGRVAGVQPSFLVLHPESASSAVSAGLQPAQQAYNEALHAVSGAPLLLFLRDDTVLEPVALRLMVEELFRSNAAIIGPKIVAATNTRLLVDVGSAIDHYGTPFSSIEPGELDQEQHDNVRDVFVVDSRAALVRADIFSALNGFDLECQSATDLDLCWRARLAGGRVVIAPDARAAALQIAGAVWPTATRRESVHGRLRACTKSYSIGSLLWALPVAIAFLFGEALAHVVRRRATVATATLRGLVDFIRTIGATREARIVTQSLRTVEDAEIRVFMIRGNARIRNLLTRKLHVDDRIADASFRTRELIDDATGTVRHAELLATFGACLLVLFAARGIITDGIVSVRGFAAWPTPTKLFDAFASARRDIGLGVDELGTPLFGLLSVWTRVFFGHVALARTVLVVGAGIVGIIATFRVARALHRSVDDTNVGGSWPAVGAAVMYAALPVFRNAVANAELGSVVAYAIVPMLLGQLLRGHPLEARVVTNPEPASSQGAPTAAVQPNAVRGGASAWTIRRCLTIALLTAIVASAAPIALFMPAIIAVGCGLGAVLTTDRRDAIRVLVLGVTGTAAAFVLLAPWSFSLLTGDSAAWGLRSMSSTTPIAELLSFRIGPNGAGFLGIAALVAAALPLVVGSGERLRVAAQAWMIALIAGAVIAIPAARNASVGLGDPNAFLALAACGISIAIAMGVATVIAELRTFVFGIRQVAVVTATLALVVPLAAWAGDLGDGRMRHASQSWNRRLDWMRTESVNIGGFRVLWLSDADGLPADGVAANGNDFLVTDATGIDVRGLLAPDAPAMQHVASAILQAHDGATTRFGHLVAPMSVRYIAVVESSAPDIQRATAQRPNDVAVLDNQLDLEILDSVDGLRLYRNLAWSPIRSITTEKNALADEAMTVDQANDAATRTDLSGTKPLRPVSTGPGYVRLSASSSDRFVARAGGKELDRRQAFGWSNGWVADGDGAITVAYKEPAWLPAAAGFAIVMWIAALLAVWVEPAKWSNLRRRLHRSASHMRAATQPTPAVSPDPEGGVS